MSKFTQGEWYVEDNLLCNEDHRLVAMLADIRDEQTEEFQANARLLKEAPKMYKALVNTANLLGKLYKDYPYRSPLKDMMVYIRLLLARIDGADTEA